MQSQKGKVELNVWEWIKDEGNTRAVGLIIVGIPAAFTFIYSVVWPEPNHLINVNAKEFIRSENVNFLTPEGCATEYLFNQPPSGRAEVNLAEYVVYATRGGAYLLYIEYAMHEPRAIKVKVNGEEVLGEILSSHSGDKCRSRIDLVGNVDLVRGNNIIQFFRKDYPPNNYFPHIKRFKFVRK